MIKFIYEKIFSNKSKSQLDAKNWIQVAILKKRLSFKIN